MNVWNLYGSEWVSWKFVNQFGKMKVVVRIANWTLESRV